jgi:hypothetical protein
LFVGDGVAGIVPTVTAALPVRSPACAVQLASVRAVIVYVVVEDGLTLRVAGLVATPLWTTESDQVTFQGPVPVRTAWIGVEPPTQIVAVPETMAVGLEPASAVNCHTLPLSSPA